MISEILSTYELSHLHLRRIVADLDELQMVAQTASASNHAAWTIGHLVVSCQAMCGELEVESWLPADWPSRFGTGSLPVDKVDDYPTKDSLLAALADGHARMSHAMQQIGEAGLLAPLPDENYRRSLPTIGHALVHILASHTALHIGQLTVWRKSLGLPRVPERFDHE